MADLSRALDWLYMVFHIIYILDNNANKHDILIMQLRFHKADILMGSFNLEEDSHTTEEKFNSFFVFVFFLGTSYCPLEQVFRHWAVNYQSSCLSFCLYTKWITFYKL